MASNKTLAIVVIVILAIAGVGVWYFIAGPAPTENVIVMGTTDSVESSLDNAQAYDYFGWEIITSLSSGLVEIEPGSQAGPDDIEPALAESWTVSEDGKVWDFDLRQGVTFDGVRPFNATVVKYTFDRNCNLTGNGLWEPDGPQLNIGYDTVIDNVTILDTYRVRFYLKIP
ncbi:MAG: ABC transporter substrate-binding protein, partial [Candidatus Thorarchaeota archaeon]